MTVTDRTKVCARCGLARPDDEAHFGVRVCAAGRGDVVDHHTLRGRPMTRRTTSVCKACTGAVLREQHARRRRDAIAYAEDRMRRHREEVDRLLAQKLSEGR